MQIDRETLKEVDAALSEIAIPYTVATGDPRESLYFCRRHIKAIEAKAAATLAKLRKEMGSSTND